MSVPLDLVAWLVQEMYFISLLLAIRQNWLLTVIAIFYLIIYFLFIYSLFFLIIANMII